MNRIITVIIIFAAVQLSAVSPVFESPEPAEKKLHELINQYRLSKGLTPIKLSRSLTYVAGLHAADLEKNIPSGRCNMHSWSGDGSWTSCCYTPDHAKASCMWNKPRELTSYPGNGYECSCMYSAGITPEIALKSWKGSSGHNAVIINQGIWSGHPWKSIGVGIRGQYAVIWFGEEEDPDGYWK
jgi:hypothetical protein